MLPTDVLQVLSSLEIILGHKLLPRQGPVPEGSLLPITDQCKNVKAWPLPFYWPAWNSALGAIQRVIPVQSSLWYQQRSWLQPHWDGLLPLPKLVLSFTYSCISQEHCLINLQTVFHLRVCFQGTQTERVGSRNGPEK